MPLACYNIKLQEEAMQFPSSAAHAIAYRDPFSAADKLLADTNRFQNSVGMLLCALLSAVFFASLVQ